MKIAVNSTKDVTWGGGRKTTLWAVIFTEPTTQKESVMSVFDSEWWAKQFIESTNITKMLRVERIIRENDIQIPSW